MPVRTRRPRYADIVGTLALVVAVGASGAYAAGAHLPKNSVTSKQVKNGSLKAADFKAGQLPAGAKGDKGAKGDTGAAGPNLLATATFSPGTASIALSCQAGNVATPTFTVKAPSIIYASGQFEFSSTVANSATAQLLLLQGATTLATSNVSAMPAPAPGVKVSLTSAGVLGTGNTRFVLQPGITYNLDLTVTQGGGCGGTSAMDEPNISYLVLPVPTT